MLNNIILGLKDFKKYWVVNVLMIILFTFTIIFVSITNLILIQEMEYRDFDINANIEDLTMFDALRKTLDTEIDEEIMNDSTNLYKRVVIKVNLKDRDFIDNNVIELKFIIKQYFYGFYKQKKAPEGAFFILS